MGSKANCCGVFGFILTLIALGLLGTSLGTTHWRTPNSGSINSIVTFHTNENTYGLFKTCVTVKGERTCIEIGWTPDEAGTTLTATRGILLFASILIVIGVFVGIASFCGSGCIKVQGVLNILGGLFVLIACATYMAMTVLVSEEVPNPPAANDYGYSHYLCWVSGVVFLFAGACGLKGKGEERESNEVYPAPAQAQMVWATTGQPRAAFASPQGQQQFRLVNA